MIIERDLSVPMDDGLVLKADVYRPDTTDPVPTIMTHGPYGKGVMYQDHYRLLWDWMVERHPDLLAGSEHRWLTWETADPEIWVPWGYALVRVDSRGAGRSPGYLDIFSPRETLDFYHAIEWAGTQPWSNGKVGLNGISYYAINQWHVAQLQPPHLTAMIPWEGAADYYRDWGRHGGILSNKFMEIWFPRQVQPIQHGNPEGPRDHWMEESATGPAELSEDELHHNRADALENIRAREMDDEWYRARSPDWSKIVVPFITPTNWAGFGIHPRGNSEAFLRAASTEKWFEGHPGRHEEWFYLPYGMELQKRFFDHYLKGEDNGWDKLPPVMLNIRHPDGKFVAREENEWPLKRTQWTKFYLDLDDLALAGEPVAKTTTRTYPTMGDGLDFWLPPQGQAIEITGPMAAKLFVSSKTQDADLFLIVRLFDPAGDEVTFMGSTDPNTPIANGWLRASHRALDSERSRPYRPYHPHDRVQTLTPGEIYECDIEIVTSCIVVPSGWRLCLSVRGKDYEYGGELSDFAKEFHYGTRGTGGMTHTDPDDRPPAIFDSEITLHADLGRQPFLLLPIIPA